MIHLLAEIVYYNDICKNYVATLDECPWKNVKWKQNRNLYLHWDYQDECIQKIIKKGIRNKSWCAIW